MITLTIIHTKLHAMKITCYYKFPCHPKEMFDNSPSNMSDIVKNLRVQMISIIAELSSKYSQKELDNKLFVDIENGDIVGFDMSELMNISLTFSDNSQRVPLGKLTAKHWQTMRVTN